MSHTEQSDPAVQAGHPEPLKFVLGDQSGAVATGWAWPGSNLGNHGSFSSCKEARSTWQNALFPVSNLGMRGRLPGDTGLRYATQAGPSIFAGSVAHVFLEPGAAYSRNTHDLVASCQFLLGFFHTRNESVGKATCDDC